jgi:hypothetical protein
MVRRKEAEEMVPFTDPQAFITRNLAERTKHVDERTRVNSYEQFDLWSYNLFLHSQLGVRMYFDEAAIDMRLMISKDGKSREEMVQSLQAMNDLQRGFNTGMPLLTEAIVDQRARQK